MKGVKQDNQLANLDSIERQKEFTLPPPMDPAKNLKEHVDEWFSLGDSLFASGQEPIALGYYKWITEVDPNNARAWRMLGLSCLVCLGSERHALAALSKATELDPSDGEAARALADLNGRLARNPRLLDQGEQEWNEILRDVADRLKDA